MAKTDKKRIIGSCYKWLPVLNYKLHLLYSKNLKASAVQDKMINLIMVKHLYFFLLTLDVTNDSKDFILKEQNCETTL